MVHRSNITYSRINQKRKQKKAYAVSSGTTENETSQTPSWGLHLEGWEGILDIDTQWNSLKTKSIQSLLNHTNAFWKDLMLYWLSLIFNSGQSLVLFRQTQILLDMKTYRNKAMRIFYKAAQFLPTFHQQQ